MHEAVPRFRAVSPDRPNAKFLVAVTGQEVDWAVLAMELLGEGKRVRTRAFGELQLHYLFQDRFGRPAKGNDKGKVEGSRQDVVDNPMNVGQQFAAEVLTCEHAGEAFGGAPGQTRRPPSTCGRGWPSRRGARPRS